MLQPTPDRRHASPIAQVAFVLCIVVANWGCQISPFPPKPAPTPTPEPPSLNISITLLQSPVNASLRGVYAISEDVCWASGSGGVWLRTTDSGETWQGHIVEGAKAIDFRDIHAFSAGEALLLTAGAPARIYRTTDGGRRWAIVHQDMREGVFFDAFAFWDDEHGIAFSDPVDGVFVIVTTDDRGTTWNAIPSESIPRALEGEAGFAASGTCLALGPNGNAWIGLGGDTSLRGARILHTTDFGQTWTVQQTSIRTTESAGIFSVVFLDERIGVVVGGDYLSPEGSAANAAITTDGGQTWTSVSAEPPGGYRSVVVFVDALIDAPSVTALLAAGPTGVDFSTDHGQTWLHISDQGFHAMSFAPGSAVGYATGTDGRIARIELTR